MIEVSLALGLISAVLFGTRLLRGPTLADRVNALNGLLVVGGNAVAVHAMSSGRGALLPVVVLAALVGFVGTAMVSRYLGGER